MRDYEQAKLWHLKLWFMMPTHQIGNKSNVQHRDLNLGNIWPLLRHSEVKLLLLQDMNWHRPGNWIATTDLKILMTLFTCWSPVAAVGLIRCNYPCLSPSTVSLFLGLLISIDALKWFIPPFRIHTNGADVKCLTSLFHAVFPQESTQQLQPKHD